jgi:RNA polymerase sigma-70 factor, ECF subfamily
VRERAKVVTEDQTQKTLTAVWRMEAARIIGGIARMVRDVSLAEDLAQEAMVSALEHWRVEGVPENPGAWLMQAAKNRALDELRRRGMMERKQESVAVATTPESPPDAVTLLAEGEAGDDVLRLMLVACHPVLSTEARVALTLRLLGGLTTEEIARAFLVPEPTVAQRIVRAKRTLTEARVPFEVPAARELGERVGSILEVIYLVFNEGYVATRGDSWLRPALCEDALRLGRALAELVPNEPEVHGLVALMEIQASRARTRQNAQGEPVLLFDQDRSRWDQLLIRRGLLALARAESFGGASGPYTLQAAIAACHARARTAEETDWLRIVALYDGLVELTGSPVVELNRAVAVSMAFGPLAGLEIVEQLRDEPALESYHLLPTVRADLLLKLGRREEARADLERAAFLAKNARERALLLARAKSV